VKKLGSLISLAIIAGIAVFYLTRFGRACNPGAFIPYPIFVNTLHPDLPIGPYTRGNLGVIQPSYGANFLYVAYRTLVGRPVQPAEVEALWPDDERITGREPAASGQAQPPETSMTPEDEWIAASGGVKPISGGNYGFIPFGVVPEAGVYRNLATGFYAQYLNCPQDAFREALNTLDQRTKQFGESSPEVQNWIAAQHAVFGNCDEGEGSVPADLPASAPVIARADRAYQQAAAYFYSEKYDEAIAGFRAIAQDDSSPWSTLAPYLVARALVRKATVRAGFGGDSALLGQAETQTNAVLADPRLAKYHHAAARLRGLIEYRLHPDTRLAELGVALMQGPSDPDLAQDSIDFLLLFDSGGNSPVRPMGLDFYTKHAADRAKSPLLDWMLTLRLDGTTAYQHALERWNVTHSPAWLVAALTKAGPASPQLGELVAAGRRLPRSSPAYASATFHDLRLLALAGNAGEARQHLTRLDINHLCPAKADTPISTLNLFRALQFELAQNLDELFTYATRVPATITTANSRQQLPAEDLPPAYAPYDETSPRFDLDALAVLNDHLPVAMLAKAVDSPALPDKLRGQVALAAWARATLLGKADLPRSLAIGVESYIPALKASVEAYNLAATPAERRFVAALAALHFPGLRPYVTTDERSTPIGEIDEYRENWWGAGGAFCFETGVWPDASSPVRAIYPGSQVKTPAFLTATEREEAAQEARQLQQIGTGPDYLSKEAVAWAGAHPADPRAPEALALAVRSTRLGCTDDETGKDSRAAFELLHRRYPQSDWAQRTKYWFK
jgi:hypothetical protein